MATINELWEQKPSDQATIKVRRKDDSSKLNYIEIFGNTPFCAVGLDNRLISFAPLNDVEGWELYSAEPKVPITNTYYTAVLKANNVIINSTQRYKTLEEAKADWERVTLASGKYKVLGLTDPIEIEDEE